MECEFAFICDYAVADRKLHAVGIGFDTIYATTLPATHPVLSLVARLKGTIAENGTKDIVIRIIDADGEDVMPPVTQQINFQVKQPNVTGGANIVAVLNMLQFKKYGAHAIHLVVHGNEMASVSFNVAQPPTTA